MSAKSTAGSAQVAAVIILAAGEGKRMRSATPKVLHEIGGRTPGRARGRRRAARSTPSGSSSSSGTAGTRSAAHLAADRARRRASPSRRSSTAPVTRSQCALAAGRRPSHAGTVVVTYGDVPLLTGETLAELVALHHEPRRRGHRADRACRRPDRVRPDRARRRRRGARPSSSTGTPPRSSCAIDEINSGIYAFDGGVLARRAGPAAPGQRPGRAVPHRRPRPAPAATAGRVGAVGRPTTSGRSRASTTGSSWPRCAGAQRPR